VYALATSGSDLYVGGRFITAGGMASNGIAKWDGKHWAPMGNGVRTGIYDGVVHAIAVGRKSIFVGGSFKTAGTATVNNTAEWNGSTWAALGAGVSGNLEQVLAMATMADDKLIAGGKFNRAGMVEVSDIAVWDGSNWSALDLRTNGGVSSIAASGEEVYFGGSLFTLPSGEESTGVVNYKGNWSVLGKGVLAGKNRALVTGLIVSGDKVYVAGGPFGLAAQISGMPVR